MAEQVEPIPEGDPARPEMALGMRYLQAIESVGGLPVVVPPLPEEDMEELIGRVSGVCLSGGPDIHPSSYGQDEDPALGPTWRDLDDAELAVARAAFEAKLPILAICRGAQALNIARSGTLFQDLPDPGGLRGPPPPRPRRAEHQPPGRDRTGQCARSRSGYNSVSRELISPPSL